MAAVVKSSRSLPFMQQEMPTVLLISDEAIPRAGLARLLASEFGLTVVGEAGIREAVRQAAELKPQVIVFHSANSVNSALIISLCKAVPDVRVAVLSRELDAAELGLILGSGALGCVLLRSSPRELFEAIRSVSQGHRFVDPALNNQLDELLARKAACGDKTLSHREKQVLRMRAQGYTLQEISTQLKINRRSVETYQSRIREKLGLRTRAEIVRYALATGLLTSKTSRSA